MVHSLCFKCLRSGHTAKSCSSPYNCSRCHKNHHSLVHLSVSTSTEGGQQPSMLHTTRGASDLVSKISLLPTAVAMVRDSNGVLQKCRALIDTGSQISCVSKSFVGKLGIRPNLSSNIKINGIGSCTVGPSRGVVDIQFSRFNKHFLNVRNVYRRTAG